MFGLLSADCLQINKTFEGHLALFHAVCCKDPEVGASAVLTGTGRRRAGGGRERDGASLWRVEQLAQVNFECHYDRGRPPLSPV